MYEDERWEHDKVWAPGNFFRGGGGTTNVWDRKESCFTWIRVKVLVRRRKHASESMKPCVKYEEIGEMYAVRTKDGTCQRNCGLAVEPKKSEILQKQTHLGVGSYVRPNLLYC